MPRWGRPALRERFDDGARPAPQRRPRTHHCDLYLATDASVGPRASGFGALLEAPDGTVLERWARPGRAADNNDAELRALHYGLDRLASHRRTPDRLGILIDHEGLGRAAAACATPEAPTPTRPPSRTASRHHWGGITARIAAIPQVRVAVVSSPRNPAHGLANGVAGD